MSLYIIAAVLMLALDQTVKYWAFSALRPQHTVALIENVFHLTYVENRGSAFSLFASLNFRWIFVALAIAITVVIFFMLKRRVLQTALGSWSLVLVAAGALGNAIDRVVYGFVVDMFDFCLIHFPVFNIADIWICVGGALFIIYFMFQHKEQPVRRQDEAAESEQDE